MKKLSLFLCITILTGCSHKTPVEKAFDDVHISIEEIKTSLPEECKTDVVIHKIEEIEWRTDSAQKVCQAKINDIKAGYERALWLLFFIFSVFLLKNFIKK